MTETSEKPLPHRSTIMVAVYWPGEGYGGATTCATIEEARAHAQKLVEFGHGIAGKHPIHIITKVVDTIEISLVSAANISPTPKAPHGRTKGWAHHNPDTGMEWSKDHPIESGECPDATDIEQMTLGEFRRRFVEKADA